MLSKQKVLYVQLRYVEIPKFYLKAYWLKIKRTFVPQSSLNKTKKLPVGY